MRRFDVQKLLKTYPRQRPPLSDRQKKIFEKEYKANREGQTFITRLARKVDGKLHRMVAKGVLSGRGGDILELGAGTLNHVPYEPRAGNYDIVEPYAFLYRDSPHLNRIRHVYADSRDIPPDVKYSRILSLGVLEHMVDLPTELRRAGGLLADGGVFQAGIPVEGGAAWGLAWRMTTGIGYRLRTGLPYKEVMRHEHVNGAPEIIALTKAFFRNVKVTWFPLPFFNGALFAFIEAHNDGS